ncbi:MAG TPA: hypothetical protein VMY88_07940 [Acidimicrobiales bacterium]|nr:hypothetical protein [Acidimicrobiales bacterium]
MTNSHERPVIRGLELRYVLVLALLGWKAPLSVAELVAAVERAGFSPPGRPGKAVADALRWEVRRGRVLRAGRDKYIVGYVAKVTRYRMQTRVARMRTHGVYRPAA